MAERITLKNLQRAVAHLNKQIGLQPDAWVKGADGKHRAQVGAYAIDAAYGNYKLERMVSEGGATQDISGRGSAREIYNVIHAIMNSVNTVRKNPVAPKYPKRTKRAHRAYRARHPIGGKKKRGVKRYVRKGILFGVRKSKTALRSAVAAMKREARGQFTRNPTPKQPAFGAVVAAVVTTMDGKALASFNTQKDAIRWAKAYARAHRCRLRIVDPR